MALSLNEEKLLAAGSQRHNNLELLHRAGNADAKLLQGLVGMRCKKFNDEYEITRIGYSYDGYITADGKKMLQTGKLSRYSRRIGPITPKAFE